MIEASNFERAIRVAEQTKQPCRVRAPDCPPGSTPGEYALERARHRYVLCGDAVTAEIAARALKAAPPSAAASSAGVGTAAAPPTAAATQPAAALVQACHSSGLFAPEATAWVALASTLASALLGRGGGGNLCGALVEAVARTEAEVRECRREVREGFRLTLAAIERLEDGLVSLRELTLDLPRRAARSAAEVVGEIEASISAAARRLHERLDAIELRPLAAALDRLRHGYGSPGKLAAAASALRFALVTPLEYLEAGGAFALARARGALVHPRLLAALFPAYLRALANGDYDARHSEKQELFEALGASARACADAREGESLARAGSALARVREVFARAVASGARESRELQALASRHREAYLACGSGTLARVVRFDAGVPIDGRGVGLEDTGRISWVGEVDPEGTYYSTDGVEYHEYNLGLGPLSPAELGEQGEGLAALLLRRSLAPGGDAWRVLDPWATWSDPRVCGRKFLLRCGENALRGLAAALPDAAVLDHFAGRAAVKLTASFADGQPLVPGGRYWPGAVAPYMGLLSRVPTRRCVLKLSADVGGEVLATGLADLGRIETETPFFAFAMTPGDCEIWCWHNLLAALHYAWHNKRPTVHWVQANGDPPGGTALVEALREAVAGSAEAQLGPGAPLSGSWREARSALLEAAKPFADLGRAPPRELAEWTPPGGAQLRQELGQLEKTYEAARAALYGATCCILGRGPDAGPGADLSAAWQALF